MIPFDVPSLIFAFAALAVATVGALWRLRLTGESDRAVRYWVRGYGVLAIGSIFLAFQLIGLNPWLITIGQALTFVGALHLPAALTVLCHRPVPVGWMAAGTTVFTAGVGIQVLSDPNADLMLFICACYIVVIVHPIVVLLSVPGNPASTRGARYTLVAFLGAYLSVLLVAVATAIWAPPPEIESVVRIIVPAMAIVAGAGLTVGFHWLVHRDVELHLEDLNARLQEKTDRLEQFARAISHDLKSPLMGIVGNLDMVMIDEGVRSGSAQARRHLEASVASADRLCAMIDGLLAWSALDEQSAMHEQADANACVAGVLQTLGPDIRNCSAVVDVESPLPTVRCNEALLSRLLQNLIANALKYRVEDLNPRVSVRAVSEGSVWRFEIADNGRGVPPDDLEEIFRVFRRGKNVAETDGTGVGLSLCKSIVEKHDGRIWAGNRPEGGAVMSFTLPAVD